MSVIDNYSAKDIYFILNSKIELIECMSNIIFPYRRKSNARSIDPKTDNDSVLKKSKSDQIKGPLVSENVNNISQSNRSIDPIKKEIITTSNPLSSLRNDIDLERLIKEYLETINEYRFHLGFSSLELSHELTNRAIHRATQLSVQNYVENTSQFDLIHNNEPIGET